MPRALRSTIESLVGVQGGEPDLTYASWKSERKPDNVAQKVCKGKSSLRACRVEDVL